MKNRFKTSLKLTILTTLLTLIQLANAQNFIWAKNMGGTSGDWGFSITTDAVGNIYTTGYFQNLADFDPGTGTLDLTSAGDADIFISKSDPAGNLIWAKSMGGIAFDRGRSITTDPAGNVYTTGYFQNTVDFDPGAGTFNLTSAGTEDIFISKLDTDGNFVWVKHFGGIGFDYGFSITTDAAGNVYTTGIFSNTADFDPGTGTFNLTSAGTGDIFISKLDTDGNFVWVKHIGGLGPDYGHSITSDEAGYIYLTGLFDDTVDFDPGAGTFNLASTGGTDIFISKLDTAGNLIWARNIGGTDVAVGRSIITDATGNVYTTGDFYGTADFDPGMGTANLTSAGYNDIFISKLDATGNFGWAKSMGGPLLDFSSSITTDATGNIYTTGNFEGMVDFDPGIGTSNLTSIGYNDIFINKLDTTGNLIWAKRIGGTLLDCGSSITTDAVGNTYTTGAFIGKVDFNPETGTSNLTSIGYRDIFIIKLAGDTTNVGLKEFTTPKITVYPNPTHGLLTIRLYNHQGKTLSYTISSLAGKIIMQAKNVTGNEIEVDLSKESKGFYLLTIKTASFHGTYKVVRW